MLVAHSYGCAFARHFLQIRTQDVAAMVMVETGQEISLDSEVDRQQYQRQILGSRPSSIIRGNSLLEKFRALEADKSLDNPSAGLEAQRKLLEEWDAEDERFKKSQLGLSSNHRYVYIPDCGHSVIRERPHVVGVEVRWVMGNLGPTAAMRASTVHEGSRTLFGCTGEDYCVRVRANQNSQPLTNMIRLSTLRSSNSAL